MASEVDICNLALSHIGQDANVTAIDPPDGSFEADKCATFYPIARDEIIEQNAWRFALTRIALTQLNYSVTPPSNWLYAYGVPNDCIRPLSLYLKGETDDTNGQNFTVETLANGETQVIYSNAPAGCTLKYLVRQANTTKFTPLFVVALSYRLASYLAGPITKDLKQKESLYRVSEAYRKLAAGTDADSQKNEAYRKDFVPGGIAARNG